jgi:hypothetical protein
VTAEEEARDASFANRQSAIGDLPSDLAGLSEPDADLLLAATVVLARYGPQGERSLLRGRRRNEVQRGGKPIRSQRFPSLSSELWPRTGFQESTP